MGRKRILKDGKKVRKAFAQKKKKKKKNPSLNNVNNSTNKKRAPNNCSPLRKKKKKKKLSYKFDWVTWNRSLITARLKDIRRENITVKEMGNVILEEITLEL